MFNIALYGSLRANLLLCHLPLLQSILKETFLEVILLSVYSRLLILKTTEWSILCTLSYIYTKKLLRENLTKILLRGDILVRLIQNVSLTLFILTSISLFSIITYRFPMVLTWRIHLTIKSFLSWWSFPLS